jgi:hypothetical protein
MRNFSTVALFVVPLKMVKMGGVEKFYAHLMLPPFDPDGDLPQGTHPATWAEFRERFCIFAGSEQRLRLCRGYNGWLKKPGQCTLRAEIDAYLGVTEVDSLGGDRVSS